MRGVTGILHQVSIRKQFSARVHLSNAAINLSTYITGIVKVIKFETLYNIILAGHSYGGMVISGVAEQVPDRIRQLIYPDACCLTMHIAGSEPHLRNGSGHETGEQLRACFIGPVIHAHTDELATVTPFKLGTTRKAGRLQVYRNACRKKRI